MHGLSLKTQDDNINVVFNQPNNLSVEKNQRDGRCWLLVLSRLAFEVSVMHSRWTDRSFTTLADSLVHPLEGRDEQRRKKEFAFSPNKTKGRVPQTTVDDLVFQRWLVGFDAKVLNQKSKA